MTWIDWVRALHVIAVIAWMAGMLYLPRLFVYHVDSAKGSPQSETFKVMERRLMRAIMNPAMVATWLFGLLLVFGSAALDWSQGWTWVKSAAVIAMSGLHGLLSRYRKDFEADRNTRSPKFFRVMNEVPTLLLIVIVIMVVVKPF